jgi:propionate CoA-transferase
MRLWDQAQLLLQLARTGLAWVRQDIDYPSPVPENPKFRSARAAAQLIADGDVVAVSGLGAHQRASILYWAIRARFERGGHPAGLTVINVGGAGGRGLAPGTLEELGQPGLCTRLITSHFETVHAMLDLAAAGRCELQCLPLGVITLLCDALGRGKDTLLTPTGVGTFLDPRVGRGSPITTPVREQLVTPRGSRLRYRLPKIDVAIFNVPSADRRGNLFVRGCVTVGESGEIARAAKRNGGRVIANVGRIVDDDDGERFLPAEQVDAVVYHPDTEQTVGIFHRDFWPAFTTESDASIEEGLERVRFVNALVPTLRRRSAADEALWRLAAATLLANVRDGAFVSIGTGLPEEVPRIVYEAGLLDRVTFLVESGAVGGVPASGVYFGAAVCPEKIVSSAALFKLCAQRLDATCLGALQVDADGNVNVSQRGDGLRRYVGPGGFIDFAEAARTVIFVSAWMHGGEVVVENGRLRIARPGAPKFVPHVDEVTFNGRRGLAAGKAIFYVTHAGVFRLTERGMELVRVMPGIDVRRDILDCAPATIVRAARRVPVVPPAIVTGEGFGAAACAGPFP